MQNLGNYWRKRLLCLNNYVMEARSLRHKLQNPHIPKRGMREWRLHDIEDHLIPAHVERMYFSL